MSLIVSQSFVVFAAILLTSIATGAIVTVPPTQAATQTTFAAAELA